LRLAPVLPKDVQLALKNQDRKTIYAFNRILLTTIWWAVPFGVLYYFAARMWRKGLVLLVATALLFILIELLVVLLTGKQVPRSYDIAISVSICVALSMLVPYDLYRMLVKKQTFCW